MPLLGSRLARGIHGHARGVARTAASPLRAGALQMYVGPPDPVSHLRPVVYASNEEREQAGGARTAHPYSLAEFSQPLGRIAGARGGAGAQLGGPLGAYHGRMLQRLEAARLDARLQSIWLDQFNQRFWTDNNARFERALTEYEAQGAQGAAVEPPQERTARFYRAWLAANATRLRAYNHMLWDASVSVVTAQVRLAVVQWYTRVVEWAASLVPGRR